MSILAAVLAVAITADQSAGANKPFDLSCTGTHTEEGTASRPEETEPFSAIFHVDLSKRLYCVDGCTNIESIDDVSPTSITFYEILSGETHIVMSVNRSTGDFTRSVTFRQGPGATTRAKCKVVPPTKTPKRLF